jgi:hypothetical protein
MNNPLFSILTLSALLASHPAYLDPGSGSFILQVIIASLLGGLFIVKVYWQKIVTFFRGLFSKKPEHPEE